MVDKKVKEFLRALLLGLLVVVFTPLLTGVVGGMIGTNFFTNPLIGGISFLGAVMAGVTVMLSELLLNKVGM